MEFTTGSPESVLRALHTSKHGLSDEAVAALRPLAGWNELPRARRSMLRLFVRQFNDFLIFILLIALGLSLISPYVDHGGLTTESIIESIAILAILIINAVLGFVQEYKAEQAIELLKLLTAPHATVRRKGATHIIASRDIVPGDIVLLEAGDKVSADGRLIEISHLEVNESTLTGESATVSKSIHALRKPAAVPADARNMVFSGTLVTRGSGVCVVTAIGAQTHIGAIASMVAAAEFPETPLKRRLKHLGVLVGKICIALCIVNFAIGWWRGMPLVDVLLIAISLAVSAVPEGLPAVVTVCLAIGVRRMVRRNALIRRLDALETLGSVTVICADKTGTITENRMRVVLSWAVDDFSQEDLAQAMASCNRAELPDIGDPTEIGLLEFARSLRVERRPIDEEIVPFTSEEKYMVTRHGKKHYLKGAPEKIVELCSDVDRHAVLKKNRELAARGLRVLACAEKLGATTRFIGLVGMEDPPRATVANALRDAKRAGIRTLMITGDNLDTAIAIARQVGVIGDGMEGHEIDTLSDAKLRKRLRTTSVFARVSPEHKVRILTCLQHDGHIVAMSGDGVNDAPALKQAHVGVAMGKVGTEVAREAASVVLADDDYATIVAAVREGRRIYDNIRKFVLYLLRANFAALILIMVLLLIGLPLPYLPIHILWINLMTDSFPALALGMEPEEPDIMLRPPRPAKESILSGQFGSLVIATLFSFGLTFIWFLYQLQSGAPLVEARTSTFTLAIFFELFLALSARSHRPIVMVGIFANRWLLAAIIFPILLQIIVLSTPLHTFMNVVPLSLRMWLTVFSLAAVSFVFFELLKCLPMMMSRKRLHPPRFLSR